ncbi:right-handed parallel beta-helix repeat-containing protein [Coraliomargarita parva]|uniref:right-handed parallel beta-helix repeat-containing protein n=1 Tax=Coraliomargarita parva TaxID=3014050 RepID=UPI0022B3C1B3|nr:right-handed parallel beta-helix repeat-containing protein [Coraliomargarita parva]
MKNPRRRFDPTNGTEPVPAYKPDAEIEKWIFEQDLLPEVFSATVLNLIATSAELDAIVLGSGQIALETAGGVPVSIRGGDGLTQGGFLLAGGPAIANSLFVAKSGNDGTGTRGRMDKPFLTMTAALVAAQAGDTIFVYPGDYTGEAAAISGKDGVDWFIFPNATARSFSVVTDISFKVDNRGEGTGFLVNSAAANVEWYGRASFMTISAGTVSVQDALIGGTTINGVATLTFRNCIFESSSNIGTVIDGANVTAIDCKFSSTANGGEAITIRTTANNDAVVKLKNCSLKAGPVFGLNQRSEGLNIDSATWAGSLILENCTIEATEGTQVPVSIKASAAYNVVIQGTLSQTHAADANVTFVGGAPTTNSAFVAI